MSTRRVPENSIVRTDGDIARLTNVATEDWIAAIHEAGHAVIARCVGYEVREIDIGNASRCRVILEIAEHQPPDGMTTPTIEDEEQDALYTLAGGVAEALRPGGDGTAGLDASDLEHFATLGPKAGDAEARAAWRLRMRNMTERLATKNWSHIETVARELVVRKRLSGTQLVRLTSSTRA